MNENSVCAFACACVRTSASLCTSCRSVITGIFKLIIEERKACVFMNMIPACAFACVFERVGVSASVHLRTHFFFSTHCLNRV